LNGILNLFAFAHAGPIHPRVSDRARGFWRVPSANRARRRTSSKIIQLVRDYQTQPAFRRIFAISGRARYAAQNVEILERLVTRYARRTSVGSRAYAIHDCFDIRV
jgi:hypothetical protein